MCTCILYAHLCNAFYQHAAIQLSIWALPSNTIDGSTARTISDSISVVRVVRRKALPGVRGDVVRVSSSVNLQNPTDSDENTACQLPRMAGKGH